MSRRTLTYVCQNCGAASARWQGKCEACGEWNCLVEEGDGSSGVAGRPPAPGRAPRKGRRFALQPLTGENQEAPRLSSGIAELDRVTGGGFVRGSVLLMAGDPGIGKSTLLIQAAASLARLGHRAVYISGEEAVAQVRLRA
jgi:DNA repair protein RadA/Sms